MAPICLLFSVTVLALLAINFWFQGSVGRIGSSYSASVLLANQTISLYLNRTDAGETPRWGEDSGDRRAGHPGVIGTEPRLDSVAPSAERAAVTPCDL